jgi:phosphohistidine phosphatase SixA
VTCTIACPNRGGPRTLVRDLIHLEICAAWAASLRDHRNPQGSFFSCGIAQAKRIGEVFRDHGITIGEVLTSPYCRCIDTGKLAFGRATPVKYLMPPGVLSDGQATLNQERVLQDIRSHRSSATLVMITHDLNISNVVLEPSIAMGDFFVLQPNGTDFDVIGKVQMLDK